MKTCAPDPNLEEHPWILGTKNNYKTYRTKWRARSRPLEPLCFLGKTHMSPSELLHRNTVKKHGSKGWLLERYFSPMISTVFSLPWRHSVSLLVDPKTFFVRCISRNTQNIHNKAINKQRFQYIWLLFWNKEAKNATFRLQFCLTSVFASNFDGI